MTHQLFLCAVPGSEIHRQRGKQSCWAPEAEDTAKQLTSNFREERLALHCGFVPPASKSRRLNSLHGAKNKHKAIPISYIQRNKLSKDKEFKHNVRPLARIKLREHISRSLELSHPKRLDVEGAGRNLPAD